MTRAAVLAAACLAAAPAAADDTPILVRFTAWLGDAEGKVRADDNGVAGTSLDVDRLLKTGENEAGFGGSVRFPMFWNLRGSIDYWGEEFTGRTTLAGPITYGGSVYPAGSRVLSELDLDVLTATIEYDHSFTFSEHSALRLSGLVGARYLDYTGRLKNTNALVPFTETEEFSIFLPTVGLRSELFVTEWWTVELMGQWFSAGDLADRKIATTEFMGGTRFNFFQGAFVGLGYRWVDLDIRDRSSPGERVDLDVEVDGVYFELGYQF